MKIVLVTLYDHVCTGARFLESALLAAGHDPALLHFKRQTMEYVGRGQESQYPQLAEGMHISVTKPEGDYYLPFPRTVTQGDEELFITWLRENQFEAVGFSILSPFAPLAARLSRRVRERLPSVKIIWGGIHPWFRPDEALQYADAVCLGEGEEALIEFANDPNRRDILNLWFNDNGTITRNDKRPLQQNLDAHPLPAFGHEEYLLEDEAITALPAQPGDFYSDAYFLSTQRGCPYHCHYCANSMRRKDYTGQAYLRRRSHEHVFGELDLRIPQMGLHSLRLLDDVFLVNPGWVKRFSEEYPSRVGLPFGCYAYPIAGTEQMMEWTREAGMVYVNIGIQTGSPYVMNEIFGRRYDLDLLERICHRADELGLLLVYDMLTFNPFENESHMRETLDFLLRLPVPADLQTFKLSLLPGTLLPSMDKPRQDVPGKIQLLYALLYHAIRHRDIPRPLIRSWADSPEFRQDPERLAQVLTVMIRDTERIRHLENYVQHLSREVSERDTAKWFLKKVYRRARRMAGSAARTVGLGNGRAQGGAPSGS